MPSPSTDDPLVTELNALAGVATDRTVRPFDIRVIGGPDAGKTFSIDSNREGRILVGQSPACAVRLADPAASRRHAALELAGGALRVTDLGSTNGTWVNGLRIYDAVLQGGETVRVGNSELEVRAGKSLEEAPLDQTHFGGFIGASDEIRCLYPTMARIAASNIPVIIEGET
jgi:pSer/pThr/pTyr-binding forkhead associated (FHA) protein